MGTPPKSGKPGRNRPSPHPPGRPSRRVRPAYTGTSTGPAGGGGCCPMVAALVSVRRGKLRLARRYALMSVRLIAARVAA